MRLSLTASFSVLVLAVAATASARPDRNSFINRKVATTSDLVSQIRNDPEVADRYQRHFAMSKGEVVDYVGGLRRSTLTKDGVYTIYSVPDAGYVKMHVGKLKRGEPVFVNGAGAPILIAKCGNPVVTGPSKVRRGNPVVVVPTDESTMRNFAEIDPREPGVEESTEFVALMPPVPEPVPIAVVPPPTPPAVEPVAPTVPATATGGGGRFPFLALLPLGFLGFVDNGGNGGGGQPVPEPATMAVLAVGAVGMLRRRRKA